MERFLCHITGVDDGSHGQLIANTKINKQTTKS
jgi:hypothetical protein